MCVYMSQRYCFRLLVAPAARVTSSRPHRVLAMAPKATAMKRVIKGSKLATTIKRPASASSASTLKDTMLALQNGNIAQRAMDDVEAEETSGDDECVKRPSASISGKYEDKGWRNRSKDKFLKAAITDDNCPPHIKAVVESSKACVSN